MAVKKADEELEELVEIFIPKGRKDETHQLIIANGVNYQVKKGEIVKVPKIVKNVWDLAVAASDEADDYETKITEKSK